MPWAPYCEMTCIECGQSPWHMLTEPALLSVCSEQAPCQTLGIHAHHDHKIPVYLSLRKRRVQRGQLICPRSYTWGRAGFTSSFWHQAPPGYVSLPSDPPHCAATKGSKQCQPKTTASSGLEMQEGLAVPFWPCFAVSVVLTSKYPSVIFQRLWYSNVATMTHQCSMAAWACQLPSVYGSLVPIYTHPIFSLTWLGTFLPCKQVCFYRFTQLSPFAAWKMSWRKRVKGFAEVRGWIRGRPGCWTQMLCLLSGPSSPTPTAWAHITVTATKPTPSSAASSWAESQWSVTFSWRVPITPSNLWGSQSGSASNSQSHASSGRTQTAGHKSLLGRFLLSFPDFSERGRGGILEQEILQQHAYLHHWGTSCSSKVDTETLNSSVEENASEPPGFKIGVRKWQGSWWSKPEIKQGGKSWS